jgi:hypothetical protein
MPEFHSSPSQRARRRLDRERIEYTTDGDDWEEGERGRKGAGEKGRRGCGPEVRTPDPAVGGGRESENSRTDQIGGQRGPRFYNLVPKNRRKNPGGGGFRFHKREEQRRRNLEKLGTW